ncbi:MAG: DNA polymerase IV [Pseudomonadota bacterium]
MTKLANYSGWARVVLHADMDAFYAAVEQLDNPELIGKPVIVGPRSQRGVALTASYEARPFGVGSAMPMAQVLQRCPHAVVVPPRFERYQAISAQVMEIFGDFSPRVEPLSLDEAFIEMTGAEHLFGHPREMGEKLKSAVLDATGLHISVGVSGTKYVAKVASGHDKPNGLTVVDPAAAKAWLAPQPIERLWGVGKKTAPKLRALGLETIGDVAALGEAELRRHLGAAGGHFCALAHAQDPRRVSRGKAAKSIGSDRTLSRDVCARHEIEGYLRSAADRLARRLRSKGYVARGVRVRLKTTQFQMLTRQCKLSSAQDTASTIYAHAVKLLDTFDHPGPFRLVGMAVFDLDWSEASAQLDLFAPSTDRRLESTMDNLAERFGKDAVVRAKDLDRRGSVFNDGVNLDYLDYQDGERVAKPG